MDALSIQIPDAGSKNAGAEFYDDSFCLIEWNHLRIRNN